MKNNDKTEEQLLQEINELQTKIAISKNAETKWQKTEEKLKAANQQLTSNEQQLRAANQQLEANNQQLIASEKEIKRHAHDLGERVKELNCLYSISKIVEIPDISLDEIVQRIVNIIPSAGQYPEKICAKVTLPEKEFKTENYKESKWKHTCDIKINRKRVGKVEVCYLEQIPDSDEGPFLKEEEILINCITERLESIVERKQAEKIQKTLYDISNALNTTDKMSDLFSKIREFLGNVLDTTNFFVALYDEKTDMISLPFDVDEKDDYETFPAGKTLTSLVIKTGKSLFAPRQLQDELNKQGKIDIIGTRSEIWLGVPLKVENKVIGVVVVQSYDDPNLYSEDDIEMLTFVSEEIALAIKHKQADENIQKAHEELKGLHKDLQKKVNNTVEELREKDHILIQQSRHAAMGEMIGNIAHQWRQPLAMVAAIIQNYEDAYEDGTLDMAYIEKHTEVIMDILTKMSRTIDDFRYFFKPNKLKENFNIKDVINKTLEFLESSLNFNQIKVSLELTADCVVQGFPNEYSQALLVILSNAKDELIERQIKAKQITILLNKIEDKYVLKISDNAGGITKEVLPKVFDPYFTTKEQGKGTGVGLYMAKMIIEKNMEGKLSAKNLKDGTEFRIEI